MKVRRGIIGALAGAAMAPLIVLALPPTAASAHGWVSAPPSRQEQCRAGTVPCGDIKYEPQSVEGPKGMRTCSGGSRFTELDNDNKGWRVTNVGHTITFHWKMTARHRTANYQYFVGTTLVKEIPGNNQQPPAEFDQTVTFNQSGRQKILVIWNIGDTANAFYNCVDVNIG
ncbi:lytic polysaccharide monooxygenase auxiliary activity family 9 protein [Fodinicola acaciae]|uniref:lytic polysaccharide monooxygenase auxiliary activity family 9 protein n=1 Tax=Fodinicola acaciae TaxID=2681555 RepID=UPI0013D0CE00|nr:lytic polysaccharide monooxygenase auxiliary activity family 9 protein [Fodinicola acaciae]